MAESDRLRHIQTVCLLILTVIASGAALHWLRPVVVPFVLALFFAIALTPIVEVAMRRCRLPRPAAVVATLLLGLVVLGGLGFLVSHSLSELARNADAYGERLEDLLSGAVRALGLERFGVNPDAVTESIEVPAGSVQSLLIGTTGAVAKLLSDGVMVLIFLCFLLFGGAMALRHDDGGPVADAVRKTRQYVIVKAILSACTGVLVGLILWLLDVPMAMAFGLLAFLLNFIPSVGSILATLLPLPMILLTPEVSTVEAIFAIALPGAVQMVIGNVIEPRIMGRSFDLHPIAILMALIFFGMLWGIVGMFLATPLTAVTKVLLERSEMTAPVARLLSGRQHAETPPPTAGQ